MCVFQKEDYKKYNFQDEKILKWILEHGDNSPIPEEERHGMNGICNRCKVAKGEDENYYLLDEDGNITDEEYIVTATLSPGFEDLIEEGEFSVSTEEEKEYYIELGYIIVYQCSHCFQWGYDVWDN